MSLPKSCTGEAVTSGIPVSLATVYNTLHQFTEAGLLRETVVEPFVNGQQYSARSRHGAPFALARALVAAGFPDQSVAVTHARLPGTMTYRSLHRMATRTIEESNRAEVRTHKFKEFAGPQAQNQAKRPAPVPNTADTLTAL